MKILKTFSFFFLAAKLLFPQVLEAKPYLWTANTMHSVKKNEKPGNSKNAEIWAAKGEYEPLQLVISAPSEDLTDIEVVVSNLEGPSGSIDQLYIETYRIHYVDAENGSPTWRGPPNLPLGPGSYPDALIPLKPSGSPLAELPKKNQSVKMGENQPYWIDIFIPKDTPAGKYKGVISVNSNQGTSEIDIDLTVWNFELPHRPSLRSMFGVWDNHKNSTEVMLKHRLMPFTLPKDKINHYDDKYGISTIGTGKWSGADSSNPHMKKPPSVEQWSKVEKSFPEEFKGLLYNYTADEIGSRNELVDNLKKWGKNIHAGSSIKNLVTMVPNPDLFDDGSGQIAIDTWVILPFQAQDKTNKKNIEYVMAKGSEVWTYSALLQDNYSPKWMIDFPPINYRIYAWINQLFGYNGLLYWRVDMWSDDPWSSFGEKNHYPGDGMLIYPGDPVGIPGGVVPSLRLKQLRESVEDYEYIEILKSMGEKDFALEIVEILAKDWKKWSDDEELLMECRRLLGEKIHYLNTSTKK